MPCTAAAAGLAHLGVDSRRREGGREACPQSPPRGGWVGSGEAWGKGNRSSSSSSMGEDRRGRVGGTGAAT